MHDLGLAVGMPPQDGGTVLVVDDDSLAQAYAKRLLAPLGFEVVPSLSGADALARLRARDSLPDVIVLDVHLTDMLGLDLLRELKEDSRLALIPVLVVTGDPGHELEALRLGASDFVSKPFKAAEMRARVQAQARMGQAVRALERAEDLLITLANIVEARNAYPESHTRNVAALGEAVGRALGLNRPEELRVLRLGGLLHDIGKIAIADALLVKPAPLTAEEQAEMRKHSEIGYNLLKPLKTMSDVLPAVLHHHERWDGSGYPRGLKGSSIPLAARVVGIADCYDAITTDRPYRKALSHERTVRIIAEEERGQWDPEVLEAFSSVVRRKGCS